MKLINRLLSSVTTIITVIIVALGINAIVNEPLHVWSAVSLSFSVLILVLSSIYVLVRKETYFNLASHLYSAVLVGRLFSTLRLDGMAANGLAELDPLLIGETGPGITNITYLSYILIVLISIQLIRLAMNNIKSSSSDNNTQLIKQDVNEWAMTFLRLYVGMMFIAHYSGHVLAGPVQFEVFVNYFSSVGFHIGAPMVILAGLIEIFVSLALVFGFMTRIASLGAVIYLLFATLWGEHFTAGYIWVLPQGGWEFSALWMFVIMIFMVTGASKLSVDAILRKKVPSKIQWLFN